MAGQRERERKRARRRASWRQRGIEDRVEKRFGRNAATPIRGRGKDTGVVGNERGRVRCITRTYNSVSRVGAGKHGRILTYGWGCAV